MPFSLPGTGGEGQGAGMQPEGRDDIYGRLRRGEDRRGQEGPGSQTGHCGPAWLPAGLLPGRGSVALLGKLGKELKSASRTRTGPGHPWEEGAKVQRSPNLSK